MTRKSLGAVVIEDPLERPRLTLRWVQVMARSWCRQTSLPGSLAMELAEVYFRFQFREGSTIERQIRVRGVDVPVGSTQFLGAFPEYADVCVREAGWIWAWDNGIVPPYPVGTLTEQGLIVGIDDIEPATYRVRADGLPGDVPVLDQRGFVSRFTRHDRAAAGRIVQDPRITLVRFEDVRPLISVGFVVA